MNQAPESTDAPLQVAREESSANEVVTDPKVAEKVQKVGNDQRWVSSRQGIMTNFLFMSQLCQATFGELAPPNSICFPINGNVREGTLLNFSIDIWLV